MDVAHVRSLKILLLVPIWRQLSRLFIMRMRIFDENAEYAMIWTLKHTISEKLNLIDNDGFSWNNSRFWSSVDPEIAYKAEDPLMDKIAVKCLSC